MVFLSLSTYFCLDEHQLHINWKNLYAAAWMRKGQLFFCISKNTKKPFSVCLHAEINFYNPKKLKTQSRHDGRVILMKSFLIKFNWKSLFNMWTVCFLWLSFGSIYQSKLIFIEQIQLINWLPSMLKCKLREKIFPQAKPSKVLYQHQTSTQFKIKIHPSQISFIKEKYNLKISAVYVL